MKFEDLDVWKISAKLATEVFVYFEQMKNRGFRDQITRAALSISSNIAEGSDRDTSKDLMLFLRYARGSCAEVRSQIYIGIKAGYIDKETGLRWIDKTRKISNMLYKLRQSIHKKAKTEPNRN